MHIYLFTFNTFFRRTPLHIAIMADNLSVFEFLIDQPNIDVDLKTVEEHPPLYYALLKYESGDTSEEGYASSLIKKGVQTNPIYSKTGDSLLQILIADAAKNASEYLLEHVTNLDHVNANGESALHVACSIGSPSVVGKLLKSGANPNLLTNELGRSPLHYCVLSGSADCIRKFIEHNERVGDSYSKVNFNGRDLNSDTPLSLALSEGRKELVPILIEGKADVNVRNGKDFTLLHQAILKEDSKTAIFLLDNGADINAQ